MRLLATLLVLAFLTACGGAAPEPTAFDATLTRVEATPSVPVPTATPVPATRTPEPGFTLIPATPIQPTDTPAPCTNDAVFVADVSVPDNSQVLPGAPIDKRWQIRNTGTCDWNADYRVAYFEGSQMNAAGEHALYPARAGGNAVVQIGMTAPDVPGEYTGRWQLREPGGRPFGQVLFIKIVVIPLPSPAPP
jgi:hypothetical protein